MSNDSSYIQNYRPRRIYVNPAPGKGAYVSLADDTTDSIIGEIELNNFTRIAVTAFFSEASSDPKTIKFHLLRFRKNSVWYHDDSISFNGFDASLLQELLQIIANLKLETFRRHRFDLDTVTVDQILKFKEQSKIFESLSNDPRLADDIFAIAKKRQALEEFAEHLHRSCNEKTWQNFLEQNPWIFGFGLNYYFLDKIGPTFEAVTTGADFNTAGKRADGLARTKAKVSQSVLIEIKTSHTDPLEKTDYRAGVWRPTRELIGAVAQSQKTNYEFSKKFAGKTDLIDQTGITMARTYTPCSRGHT